EPGQSSKTGRELRPLARLAREPDRLVVAGLAGRPLVARGLVASGVVEQEREHADRRLLTRRLNGLVDERAEPARLPQPDRPHGSPREQARIPPQLRRRLDERHRLADERRSSVALAAEDEPHAVSDAAEERR